MKNHTDYIFNASHKINTLLLAKNEFDARNELIKLLDYHETNKIEYSDLVNHLIKETGLFPYLRTETACWSDRYIYELFKVNTGSKRNLTLHREQSALLKKLLAGGKFGSERTYRVLERVLLLTHTSQLIILAMS